MDNQNNGYYQYPQYNNGNSQQNNGFPQQNNTEVGKGLKIGSLVAGIVSIVIPPISFISSIVGIVLGSKYKKLTGQGCAGKGVSIAGLVLSIIYFVIFCIVLGIIGIGIMSGSENFDYSYDYEISGPSFEYEIDLGDEEESHSYKKENSKIDKEEKNSYTKDNGEFDADAFEEDLKKVLINGIYGDIEAEYLCGEWDLYSFGGNGPGEEVVVNFVLEEDGTFEWKFAEDPYNNYVKGTYTFEDLNKTNYDESARYVEIHLEADEFVIDGVEQSESYKSRYEVCLISEDGTAKIDSKYDVEGILMINIDTYNMYCAER